VHRAHAIIVLTLGPAAIARLTAFQEPAFFDRFGLPPEYPVTGLTPARG